MALADADVAALVRQLGSSRRRTQLQAAQALKDFIYDSDPDGGATAVAAAGGVPVLVRCLDSPTRAVQEVAAGVLSHVSSLGAACEEQAAAIVAAGAVPRLLRLFSGADGGTSGAAASTLSNLCAKGGAECGAALLAAEGVDALVGRMAPSAAGPGLESYPHVGYRAVSAVRNLTATCVELRDSGGGPAASAADGLAQALVGAGAVPAATACLCHGRCEKAVANAAVILQNLMVCSMEVAQEVAASAALPALVQQLSTGSERVRVAAADALAAVARSNSLAEDVQAAGAMAALLQLLQRSTSDAVLASALGALASLARFSAGWPGSTAASAAPPLVALLNANRSEAVLLAAAKAVRFMAGVGRDSARRALQEAGAPAALQRVLSASPSADLRSMAAPALRNVILYSDAILLRPPEVAYEPPSTPAQRRPRAPRAPRVCAAPGCGATSNLHRCGGCHSVRYCSAACSRAHWREHRAECRRLQAERASG